MNPSILIVGAGPVGLTLANFLTRSGIAVRLIDKAPQAAKESRALAVHARTMEMLDRIGLAERFIEQGVKIHSVNFRSVGRELMRLSFDELPTPFPFILSVPQSPTEALLAEDLASRGPTLKECRQIVHDRGPTSIEVMEAVWTSTFRINERGVDRLRVGRSFVAGQRFGGSVRLWDAESGQDLPLPVDENPARFEALSFLRHAVCHDVGVVADVRLVKHQRTALHRGPLANHYRSDPVDPVLERVGLRLEIWRMPPLSNPHAHVKFGIGSSNNSVRNGSRGGGGPA